MRNSFPTVHEENSTTDFFKELHFFLFQDELQSQFCHEAILARLGMIFFANTKSDLLKKTGYGICQICF